jgi:2-phosphoglycerate kinase
MPETIVVNRSHGLPYSKGLMAQSLSATGLAPERAYDLARLVERVLNERGASRIDVAGLHVLTEDVLRAEEGETTATRYRRWRRLDRLDRPLVVMLGGTTGVGKSTLATMLAHRLGITRVIATDVIRQVLRAFFTHDFMPSVHYSAFEAGRAVDAEGDGVTRPVAPGEDEDLLGYLRQADRVGTGIAAIVERACNEATAVVVEGVHVVPGALDEVLRRRCVAVEAVLAVGDEELHRGHFSLRGGRRPPDRYLARFGEIRKLQDFLTEQARAEGVAVIDNANVDQTLGRLMELVLDTAGRASGSEVR